MKTGGDGVFDDRGDDSADATRRKVRGFFQFNLRQILLLFAVSAVLLSILTPRIRRSFHLRRLQQEADQRAIAEENLRAAALTDPVALARRAVESDLRAAVNSPNIALARLALEAGADPNLLTSTNGMDPTNSPRLLSTCIVKGQFEMVELLLEFGADVEYVERIPQPINAPRINTSPLFVALDCDQPPEIRCKMVRLLIAHGADLRRDDGHLNAMDNAFHRSDGRMGDLLREYGLPYGPREMAGFNRLDELKEAVQERPEILKERFKPTWAARPGHGPTVLGIALERGYHEMALFLIDAGAPLDVIEYQGSTLLHQAAKGGDPVLIRLLVARGLDVNATDDYGDTPLGDIAGRKNPQAVAALLEAGADVNRHGINDRTPLHSAVSSDRIDIVQMLLAAGADPTLRDIYGETPLDLARTRNGAIADLLEQAEKDR